jgi:hypothetical protein
VSVVAKRRNRNHVRFALDAGVKALVSFTGACAAPARSTDEAGLLTVTIRQSRGGHCQLTVTRDAWAAGGRGFRLRAPR